MKLLNKLEKNGIIDALSEIGFSPEKMFSDLDETSDTLYSKYEWVRSECHVDGVDKQYVINAIPNDFSKLAWEEWYSSGGKPIHHILCADKWAECTDEHPTVFCKSKPELNLKTALFDLAWQLSVITRSAAGKCLFRDSLCKTGE